jgi:hypothetical protein
MSWAVVKGWPARSSFSRAKGALRRTAPQDGQADDKHRDGAAPRHPLAPGGAGGNSDGCARLSDERRRLSSIHESTSSSPVPGEDSKSVLIAVAFAQTLADAGGYGEELGRFANVEGALGGQIAVNDVMDATGAWGHDDDAGG